MAPALPAAAVLQVTTVIAACCRHGRASPLWLLNGRWELDLLSTSGSLRRDALCNVAWHAAIDVRPERSTEHLPLC